MRILVGMAAAALMATLTVTFGVTGASAKTPPRVPTYSCSALAAKMGHHNIWQAVFLGKRKGLLEEWDTINVAPCFPSEAQCKAWLYWEQTDYPYFIAPQPCRKGGY